VAPWVASAPPARFVPEWFFESVPVKRAANARDACGSRLKIAKINAFANHPRRNHGSRRAEG